MSDTGFDETPDITSSLLKEFAEAGFINFAGGCCGTTPEHIAAIAKALAHLPPRQLRRATCRWPPDDLTVPLRLSGLEPFNDRRRLAVRQRRRAHQRHRLEGLRADDPRGAFDDALVVARQQVENGAQIIDINMDEAMLDSKAAMVRFLNLIASEPDIARVPIMIDSSKWDVIEAGLKCVQGKAIVNSISMKEGEEAFLQQAKLCKRYGAAAVVMAFDEKGQADTFERKIEICKRAYDAAGRRSRLPARGHHLRPEHLRDRDRHRGAQQLRGRLHRRDALDHAPTCRTRRSRAACRT